MNREELKELGLTDDQIENVMKSHGKAIQAVKPADYEDLKSAKATFEQQLTNLKNTITAKDAELGIAKDLKAENEAFKLKDLKTSIAMQAGIPFEFASRLNGATEEEIKADAESFAGFVSKTPPPLPLGTTEPSQADAKDKAYATMLSDLKLEGE